MTVIGAGSAGLVSAYIAAAVKAKVALIEKQKMGGDCAPMGGTVSEMAPGKLMDSKHFKASIFI